MRTDMLLLITLAPLWAADTGKPLLSMDDFVKDWKISKQFTIDVAEKMPSEHYGFKPTPEQLSFGEQMVHIAGSIAFRFAQVSGKPSPIKEIPAKIDREIAVKYLNQAFAFAIEALPHITPEQMDKTFDVKWNGRPVASGREVILNMFVHTAHHRAAAEVYLRLKGVEPPFYTF